MKFWIRSGNELETFLKYAGEMNCYAMLGDDERVNMLRKVKRKLSNRKWRVRGQDYAGEWLLAYCPYSGRSPFCTRSRTLHVILYRGPSVPLKVMRSVPLNAYSFLYKESHSTRLCCGLISLRISWSYL